MKNHIIILLLIIILPFITMANEYNNFFKEKKFNNNEKVYFFFLEPFQLKTCTLEIVQIFSEYVITDGKKYLIISDANSNFSTNLKFYKNVFNVDSIILDINYDFINKLKPRFQPYLIMTDNVGNPLKGSYMNGAGFTSIEQNEDIKIKLDDSKVQLIRIRDKVLVRNDKIFIIDEIMNLILSYNIETGKVKDVLSSNSNLIQNQISKISDLTDSSEILFYDLCYIKDKEQIYVNTIIRNSANGDINILIPLENDKNIKINNYNSDEIFSYKNISMTNNTYLTELNWSGTFQNDSSSCIAFHDMITKRTNHYLRYYNTIKYTDFPFQIYNGKRFLEFQNNIAYYLRDGSNLFLKMDISDKSNPIITNINVGTELKRIFEINRINLLKLPNDLSNYPIKSNWQASNLLLKDSILYVSLFYKRNEINTIKQFCLQEYNIDGSHTVDSYYNFDCEVSLIKYASLVDISNNHKIFIVQTLANDWYIYKEKIKN